MILVFLLSRAALPASCWWMLSTLAADNDEAATGSPRCRARISRAAAADGWCC